MKYIPLLLPSFIVLLFLYSCKKENEIQNPSENIQQTLSDTAWLKLTKQTSEWRGLFQNGIQDISFNQNNLSLLILTNTELVQLNNAYEIIRTNKLLNDIYFSQIRFLTENEITYSYSIFDGMENGIGKYKPGFCTQNSSQTIIETQKAYTQDSSSNLYFGLASIDQNFRVYAVTNLIDNSMFVRIHLLKNNKVITHTDIPISVAKGLKAFNIQDNLGVIIGDNFYQLSSSGQLSNPIVSSIKGKEIVPYKDGILVADENRTANYLSHSFGSNCPFSDYIVSDAKVSIDEDFILIRRSKVAAGKPFISGELVFIHSQTEKENIISESSIRIEDIKAFWIANNTAYIITTEGVFARLLK